MTSMSRMGRVWTVVLVTAAVAGCAGDGPRVTRRTEAPSTAVSTSAAPRPTPSTLLPRPEPAELDFGRLEFGRPATAAVTVRPGRRPVRFGPTELRGSPAYELTADSCGGRTLTAASDGCRLEVTVLSRASGDLRGKLVLPTVPGPAALQVPLTATVPLSYAVSITVAGRGTVTGDAAGIACSGTCTARVAQGTVLVLTASPAARWGGDCSAAGTAATCRLPVTLPRQVSVAFR